MWIIVALIILAALVIFVLSVPLDLKFQLNTCRSPKFRMRLLWFFGLIDKELKKTEQKPKQKKPARKKGRRGDFKKAGTFFQILRTRGLLKQLWQLVRDILSRFKIREIGINLRIGLDNPADTGMLFAIVAPANYFLGSCLHKDINIQPSYDNDATFEGCLHGAVRVQPIRFIKPIAKFAFSLPTIRIIKQLVVAKWKRKI